MRAALIGLGAGLWLAALSAVLPGVGRASTVDERVAQFGAAARQR
jgi:hypothetical protein